VTLSEYLPFVSCSSSVKISYSVCRRVFIFLRVG